MTYTYNSAANEVIAGLARYPVSGPHKWIDGQEVREGQDFKLEPATCGLCGYFCNNAHHHNNWCFVAVPITQESLSDDDLFAITEKIAMEQFSSDPMGDVVAKMGLLRAFINEKVLPHKVAPITQESEEGLWAEMLKHFGIVAFAPGYLNEVRESFTLTPKP